MPAPAGSAGRQRLRAAQLPAEHCWLGCLSRLPCYQLMDAIIPMLQLYQARPFPSRAPASNRRRRRYRRPPPYAIGTPHDSVAKRCSTQGPLIFILYHSSLLSNNTIVSYLSIHRRYPSSPLPCRHSRRRPSPTRLSLSLAPFPAASRVFWLASWWSDPFPSHVMAR